MKSQVVAQTVAKGRTSVFYFYFECTPRCLPAPASSVHVGRATLDEFSNSPCPGYLPLLEKRMNCFRGKYKNG